KGPKTMSPRRDRKSETTTREKWPQRRPLCLQVLISGFRRVVETVDIELAAYHAVIELVSKPEPFLLTTHRPVKTAVRRSTKDLIPSFASSLFITRSRIFGTTAIAACSPASMNLRPASLVT